MRGEVTTQVARMLASRATSEARIFYIANCIRFQEMRSISQREFWQAGAELIGGTEAEGDAEAIALALSALEAIGIRDAYVDIGNAGLFRELANGLGVSNLEGLKRAMESRSLAGLKGAVREGKAFNVFSSLIKRRGGIDVIEDAAKGMKGARRYLEYFRQLFARLEAYGLRSRVNIDLTTLREMEYYNGTVFDVYVGGVGVPIGGGGRYDTMMEEFGMGGAKATGFAVSVDLCVRALDSKGFDYGGDLRPLRILFEKGCADRAIGIAEELRRKGIACTADAYKGEREGVLVGEKAIDLATGKVFRSWGLAKK
jgi:ATP phosphoribosyltransferase regulatory subunit HisZ